MLMILRLQLSDIQFADGCAVGYIFSAVWVTQLFGHTGGKPDQGATAGNISNVRSAATIVRLILSRVESRAPASLLM